MRKRFLQSDGVLRKGVAARYAAIDTMRTRYPLKMLCDELSVSKSGYSEWRFRLPSKRAVANATLVNEIRVIHAWRMRDAGLISRSRQLSGVDARNGGIFRVFSVHSSG
jgi:hypothetical protein